MASEKPAGSGLKTNITLNNDPQVLGTHGLMAEVNRLTACAEVMQSSPRVTLEQGNSVVCE